MGPGVSEPGFRRRRRHLRALAGNGPVVIPKDGSEPFTLSSAEPTDVQIERLERTLREQDSHPLLDDDATRHQGRRISARTASEAQRLVETTLAASTGQDGVERAVLGEPIEAGRYWVFLYQAKAYIDCNDLDAMLLGNAPIVVPKDGGELFTLSVSDDLDAQVRALTERG